MSMKKPAVFLDRDGTLNEQMGYINHIRRFVLLPGVAEAIRLLNQEFLVLVVSNQSGVARGYFPIKLVLEVHERMKTLLQAEHARVDGIFFCPHHPGGSIPEYATSCPCRKPRDGLIKQACREFDIDLAGSFVIGDRCLDMEFAQKANLEGILVKTGYGLGEVEYVLPHSPFKPLLVASDLLDAARWLLETKGGIPRRPSGTGFGPSGASNS